MIILFLKRRHDASSEQRKYDIRVTLLLILYLAGVEFSNFQSWFLMIEAICKRNESCLGSVDKSKESQPWGPWFESTVVPFGTVLYPHWLLPILSDRTWSRWSSDCLHKMITTATAIFMLFLSQPFRGWWHQTHIKHIL